MTMRMLISIAIVCAAATAYADDPWEQGVSKENQTKANALFAEGNQLFAQQAHGPALEKYKTAVALWDHPKIRYNIAVVEIRLDRYLEAVDDLEAALRFGQSPFSAEEYQRALDYQKLVSGRVGSIEIECGEPNAQILLDGKPWFKGPGKQKTRVLTGEHALVVEKKDYMTFARRLVVLGAKTASEKIALVPVESVVKLEYATPRWVPWTVFSAGAGIAAGGLGFWLSARQQMTEFEQQFARDCPNGCPADLPDNQALRDKRNDAELNGKIGVTAMIAGGVVAVGGAVWTILNRPRRVMPTMEVSPVEGGATAAIGWHF